MCGSVARVVGVKGVGGNTMVQASGGSGMDEQGVFLWGRDQRVSLWGGNRDYELGLGRSVRSVEEHESTESPLGSTMSCKLSASRVL